MDKKRISPMNAYKALERDVFGLLRSLKNEAVATSVLGVYNEYFDTIKIALERNIELEGNYDLEMSNLRAELRKAKDDTSSYKILSDKLYLENKENKTKANIFDIVKKKRINVGNFIDMLEDWNSITYENWLVYRFENDYELQYELNEIECGIITKEEFDSLKEALK